jgi:hypothetical protein
MNILFAFVIGFYLGHVSFAVGAVFALEGTKALVQIILYRSAWIRFLKEEVPRLFRKTPEGRILVCKIHRNQLTGDTDRCSVSFEYGVATASQTAQSKIIKLVGRIIDSQEGKYSLDVVQYLLEQVQEEEMILKSHQDSEKVTGGFLYLAQDPEIGFPLHYIENKRQDLLFWAQYVDLGIAFFAFHVYFLAAFIYANLSTESLEDVWIIMLQSALSPLLMSPYLVVQSKANHRQRMDAWKHDPMLVVSDFESLSKYWNCMGSTMLRKLYTISFLLGICIICLCCGWTALFLGLGMVYVIIEWVDAEAPIQRDTLLCFQRQAMSVSAAIDNHWWEQSRSIFFSTKKYYFVSISYALPSGHTVTKHIQSQLLYEECNRHGHSSTDILVDPHFPLSGYPTLQFFWDLHNSWPMWCWHLVSFFTMWFYLILACLALDVDLDYPPEELIIPIFIILLGPVLLLPHASVWRRKEYHQYLLRLYETGNFVARPVEPISEDLEVKLNFKRPDDDDDDDDDDGTLNHQVLVGDEYDEYSHTTNSDDDDCDDDSKGSW